MFQGTEIVFMPSQNFNVQVREEAEEGGVKVLLKPMPELPLYKVRHQESRQDLLQE